jgi:hypothetical protein
MVVLLRNDPFKRKSINASFKKKDSNVLIKILLKIALSVRALLIQGMKVFILYRQ